LTPLAHQISIIADLILSSYNPSLGAGAECSYLILKNISMFNKLGKLLKQQKILFRQYEHNLTIQFEIPLATLFFLLVSVFLC